MKGTQNIPLRLKELRKKHNYSQAYVAEQLNISRQSISHWENGKSYPDMDNAILLAELFEVTVDELLEDNHEQQDDENEENDDSDDRHALVSNNYAVLEMIGLAVILVLSLQIPLGGIISSIMVCCWLKRTNRKYFIIYFICITCILVNIYDIYIVLEHVIHVTAYDYQRIDVFN
ncbi:MAG: helix-turn-helix transcriptional regulator [Lachnospiraceae bacterium]|nr:helix-turn-helix transcriptional regulator [Lachnospiraceae bacterium]